jgi:N-formylglutamate deformylase
MSEPIFEYLAGDLPLLISFPHSGTYLPPDLRARLRPQVLDLPDTDWFVPELYDFLRDLGAGVIRATHSRYVVDLNRPPDGAPLYPGQRETTVCPTESFDGEPLYAPGPEPTGAEITARLEAYWRPYHSKISATVRELVQRHGVCLLWDAHSIHSTVPGLFAGRLADLNVGTAGGNSCSSALSEVVMSGLRHQTQFSHVLDGRFKGGYITRHYGDPAARVHAIQLEIAQSAYLQEMRNPSFDATRAKPLNLLLRTLIQGLLATLPSLQRV